MASIIYTRAIFTRTHAARKTNASEKTRCKIQASLIFIYERNFCLPRAGGRSEERESTALATDSQQRINRSRESEGEREGASERAELPINQNYCGAISVCFLFAYSQAYLLN